MENNRLPKQFSRRRRKIWHAAVSVFACMVVFVTTYMLILPAITMDTLHTAAITGAGGVQINLRVVDGVRKVGSRDVTAETEALMDELSRLAVTACVDYDPAEGAAAVCGLDAPAAVLTLTCANAVGTEEALTVTIGLPTGDGGRYVTLNDEPTIYRMEETSLVQVLTLAENGLS